MGRDLTEAKESAQEGGGDGFGAEGLRQEVFGTFESTDS